MSAIGAGAAYFMARSAADEFSSKLEEASKGATGGSGSVASGDVCAQAATCCAAMVTKSGGNAEALKACESVKTLPSIGCSQALESYKKAAVALGFTCE